MVSTVALSLLLSQGGALAVANQGIGYWDGRAWHSLEALESQKTPDATVRRLTENGCWVLGSDGTSRPTSASLNFEKDDSFWVPKPSNGASIDMADKWHPLVFWFGAKPVRPKVTHVKPDSPIYSKVAKSFLKSKGFENARPILDSVDLVDLDGDGNEEAVIVLSSRKLDDMSQTYQGNMPKKAPGDYAAILIRYQSGASVKTCECFYTDGRKSGLSELNFLLGFWNLDGSPGAQMIFGYDAYEASGAGVLKFAHGKAKVVAASGWGV